MEIKLESPLYEVTKLKRKSKANLFCRFEIGTRFQIESTVEDNSGFVTRYHVFIIKPFPSLEHDYSRLDISERELKNCIGAFEFKKHYDTH